MRLLSRFGLAALVSLLVSSLIALASYSLGLWLGRNSDNLWLLIRGSVPLALLLGVAAIPQPRRRADQHARLALAALTGAALGFLYTVILAKFFWWVFPAFGIVMLSCWVPSGISAIVVATGPRRLATVAGIAILCMAAIFLPEPLFNAVTHNQQLTVAFVTPTEMSTAQFEVSPDGVGFCHENERQIARNEVLQRVRTLGYIETFRVLSITRWGKGSKSLAILIVRAPITKKVTLPVPDKGTVVYDQHSENWDKKPMGAPVLHRGITMRPPGTADESLGYFEIPDAQGMSLMGTIISKTPVQSR